MKLITFLLLVLIISFLIPVILIVYIEIQYNRQHIFPDGLRKRIHNLIIKTKPPNNKISTLTFPLEPCSCFRTVKVNWLQPGLHFTYVNSNCGYWATARGTKQKVVSYSLYGEFPSDYHAGIEKLALLVKKFYSGWTMRIYHNEQLWLSPEQRQWACSLACNHSHVDFCDITKIPELGNVNGTWGSLWRFIVVGDRSVDHYMIRDADSPILQREVDAVNEWIKSGKCYHVMRDNPNHAVKMMAGLWGGCNTRQKLRSKKPATARKMMLNYGKKVNQDQEALWVLYSKEGFPKEVIKVISSNQNVTSDGVIEQLHMWPQVQRDGIYHDSFTCMRFDGSKPFPSKREGKDYVGMRTYRKNYKLDGIRRTCPEICRPKDHQDWEDC